jgi:hypothetical protein
MVSIAATMRWLLVITPSFKGTLKSTLKIIRDQNKDVLKLSHNITVIAETLCIIYKIFLLTSSKFVYRQDLGCQLPVCSMPWLNYHNDSQPQIKTIHNNLQNQSPSASEGHSSCSLDTEQANRADRCGRILSTVKVKVTLRRLQLTTYVQSVCLDRSWSHSEKPQEALNPLEWSATQLSSTWHCIRFYTICWMY